MVNRNLAWTLLLLCCLAGSLLAQTFQYSGVGLIATRMYILKCILQNGESKPCVDAATSLLSGGVSASPDLSTRVVLHVILQCIVQDGGRTFGDATTSLLSPGVGLIATRMYILKCILQNGESKPCVDAATSLLSGGVSASPDLPVLQELD
ncbi:hypothetical protein J6590_004550 [Homalodisca vitripennis]|nr:hypothetical protein J6590_004550 [Homalodisca vitripennis]